MFKRLFVSLLILSVLFPCTSTLAEDSITALVDTPGSATDVAVEGFYAYVADADGGLRVIDVNDPELPWEVGSVSTPGVANGVAIYGDYALVAAGVAGLQIYSLADPLDPQPFGGISISGSAGDVFVSGNYAYVAAGSGGLQIVDISNILAPYLIISYDTPGEAMGVTVYDDLAYVADGSQGLQMIDVGDPSFPTVIGAYPVPETTHWVTVAGDVVFVASSEGLMSVYTVDASDPSDPQLIERQAPSGSPRSVAVVDDLAYVADLENGLKIISLGKHLPGKINYPNGGERFTAGQTVDIVWNALVGATSYEVYFNAGDGADWSLLSTVDATTYSWQVPSVSEAQLNCRIRVKAFNAAGTLVGDDLSDNPFAITFSAGSAGTVTLPEAVVGDTFLISWDGSALPGVTYVLEMSKDGAPYVEVYRGPDTSVEMTGLYDGTYRFRVKVIKEGYLDGVWSEVGTTAVTNPQPFLPLMVDDIFILIPQPVPDTVCAMPTELSVPVQNTTLAIPVSWNKSSTWGSSYVLEMSSDGGLNYSQVYSGGALSADVAVPGTGNYCFRIKAIKDDVQDSVWALSGMTAVVLGAPSMLTVQAASDDGKIAISWTASETPGAEYVVEMANGEGVIVDEVYRGGGLAATVTVGSNGDYSFRAKAVKSGYPDSAWVPGTACVVRLACRPSDDISAVPNDAAGTIAVNWGASSTAGVTYILEMSTDEGLNYSQVYTGAATTATITPQTAADCRFRVKAIKDGMVDSNWAVSADVPFRTVADKVVLTVPSIDNDGNYTISWSASQYSGATYVVQEALDSSFTVGMRPIVSYSTARSASITSRNDYKTYYYRIRVSVPGKEDGAWSSVKSTQIEYLQLPDVVITSPYEGAFYSGSSCGNKWWAVKYKAANGSFPTGTTFVVSGSDDVVDDYDVTVYHRDISAGAEQGHIEVYATKPGYRSGASDTVGVWCVSEGG